MADLFELELHETDNVEEEFEDDAIEVDTQVSLITILQNFALFSFKR